MKGDYKQVPEEIENLGHKNWDPISHTDWLLLEIVGNFLTPPSQVDKEIEIEKRLALCPW